ncbi:hypothetical protein T4C_6588 [Trichinella pseudospiralis]|uniref:Uncharacterized protein n=1 Tax=Trichinella pseudospiralis TaxID=6337 RepID=A0A0V1JWV6_TRIPS|nr:hypothetical protein T4C_6588 [Trichinella pseudospiralis]
MFIPFSVIINNPNIAFEEYFLNSEDWYKAKLTSMLIAAIASASSVFNKEHYLVIPLKTMDFLLGLNTSLNASI